MKVLELYFVEIFASLFDSTTGVTTIIGPIAITAFFESKLSIFLSSSHKYQFLQWQLRFIGL